MVQSTEVRETRDTSGVSYPSTAAEPGKQRRSRVLLLGCGIGCGTVVQCMCTARAKKVSKMVGKNAKSLKLHRGLEPRTLRLLGACSTTELMEPHAVWRKPQ